MTSSFATRSKTSVQKQEVPNKKNARVLSDEEDYHMIKEEKEASSGSSSDSFEDDIVPAKRSKTGNSARSRGNRSRSRSNQSGLITTTVGIQKMNLKKRKIDEISTASGGAAVNTNNLQKNAILYKQNDLWIEKYAPQALDEMII